MQYQSDLGRQRPQCTQIAARGSEIIVGNDFDQIDPVEMRKNPGGELGTPAEAEPVAAQLPPHPPQPPPPPPPQPEPQADPQPPPELAAFL